MKTTTLRLWLTFLTMLALAASGCAHKKEEQTTDDGSNTAPVSDTNIGAGNADSDSGQAGGMETVHFGYDTSVLNAEAKNTLKNNARIMKDKAGLKVQIEGHCDDRGGIQYNIALGERRANSCLVYLRGLGISQDRISVISYGKEKPIDPGHDEAAWAKNRRANFRITEK